MTVGLATPLTGQQCQHGWTPEVLAKSLPAQPQCVCLLVGWLTSRQHASVSQGWICSDKCMCCHTGIEVADQTCYHTQSQNTDTGLTSPRPDCTMVGARLRQVYVLPHWDRSGRSNLLSHPVTEYWHWADQSQPWLYNSRGLAREPLE